MNVKKININQSEQTYGISSDDGYLYAGMASPTTDPGTPDTKVVYFANTAGTYVHFDNITVEENQVVALYNINGSWESHEITNNTVTTDKIVDGAVSTDKLQDEIKEIVEGVKYIKHPKFVRCVTDNNDKILWWIWNDGRIDWAKGVPTPIQEELKKLEQLIRDNTEGAESVGEVVERVTANENAIIAINNEFAKYKIEVTNALDKKIDEVTLPHPTFIKMVTDVDGKIICGVNKNGKTYISELENEQFSNLKNSTEDIKADVIDVKKYIETMKGNAPEVLKGFEIPYRRFGAMTTLTVKKDGSGDFTSIQEAINSISDATAIKQYDI